MAIDMIEKKVRLQKKVNEANKELRSAAEAVKIAHRGNSILELKLAQKEYSRSMTAWKTAYDEYIASFPLDPLGKGKGGSFF